MKTTVTYIYSFLFSVIFLLSIIQRSEQTIYSCNASASCGCSTNSASVSRIVGGENAATSTWGWTVSLKIADGYLCGGSIISSSWVITAAHCVQNYTGSQIIVYAGSTSRWTGTQTRVGSQIIVHPKYNLTTFVNDIALIKVATSFTLTDSQVDQICLPSVSAATLAAGEWPAVGTSVVAVGWGRLTEGGSLPSTLQQVTVQTVAYSASTCSSLIDDWHTQLCAGVSGGGKDTCQGDSGGPLMMFTSNNQWILVGLTSNGIGCAEAAYSGVYTRVATFTDWINGYINGSTSATTVSVSSTASTSTKTTTSTTSISFLISHANTIKMSFLSIFTIFIYELLMMYSF